MEITIKNSLKAECFACIFQHIKHFSEKVNIMFEKERLYLQALDGSRVSIFELYIPKNWFDNYNYTNETGLTLGINTNILFRILNTYENGQIMNIVFDNEYTDKLSIHFTNDDENKKVQFKNIFNKHFEIPLLDIDCEIVGIPDFESQADIIIPSNKFASIINQLKMFGEILEIECSEEKIMLASCSQESGKMFVEMNLDDLNTYSINEGQELKISFGLTYLQNICAYSKISKDIEIKITENYPLKITYDLLDNAKIVYYLAPKINDE